MKILFVGDIVGGPGRKMLKETLPRLQERMQIDFTIVNCENAAGGFGITQDMGDQLFAAGADALTSGNHIWDKKESIPYISTESRLIRPANYPPLVPGRGWNVFSTNEGQKIGVINLLGRVFMDPVDCPFQVADRDLPKLKEETKIIVVDMHGEASSEKIAMGWYLDGKVSAVVGSHTHVQTADEKILPRGTAYITDMGMTGPSHSVIGVKTEIILDRFLTKMPKRFEMAGGPRQLDAVTLEIDETTGKAKKITRIQMTDQ